MHKELDVNSVYQLYANCKPVSGAGRDAIIDLQRNDIYTLPKGLCNILLNNKGQTIKEILTLYPDNESRANVIEYFQFLLREQLVYPVEAIHINAFVNFNDDWNDFSVIGNLVLYYFEKSNCKELYQGLCCSLNNLLCRAAQYISLEKLNLQDLKQFLECSDTSTITHIELILTYNEEVKDCKHLIELANSYNRIKSIIVYNAPFNAIYESGRSGTNIWYYDQLVVGAENCGKIGTDKFIMNHYHYTESLSHNTCLNRKIAIDTEGYIKNCPAMKDHYGNIKDTTLEKAVSQPGFKKYWTIKKDEITKCKDCEFRHVCTDCRAYTDDPGDLFSAPLKCGYNPYTCEWEAWSTNPLKQKAIDFYRLRDLVTNE